MFLFLACTAPGETGLPSVDDTVADSHAGTDSPVDTVDTSTTWQDPIINDGDLPLDTQGMELTDALMAGDIVILSGQQQQGKGGIWTYDPSTGDSHKLDLWTVQDVCWDGLRLWGVNRNSTLYNIALDGHRLELMNSWNIGGMDGGVHCDVDHLAYGRGSTGAYVHTKEDNWQLGEPQHIDEPTWGVLVDGDTLWTAGQDRLHRWSLPGLEHQGSLTLAGSCRQLDGTKARLVAACGEGGVFLIEDGVVTAQWTSHAAARHAVLWEGGVLVAAWTELVALDEDLNWVGSEDTRSATMAVTTDGSIVYAAEWSTPWAGSVPGHPSPEARVTPERVSPGFNATIHNDGSRSLVLDDGRVVEPGGRVTWTLAETTGTVTLGSNDPDEPQLAVTVGGNGVGDPAPDFVEVDTDGVTWELEKLRGEVVWLGLFQEG